MNEQYIYKDEFLTAKRAKGDPSADHFILEVFAGEVMKPHLQQWLSGKISFAELTSNHPAVLNVNFIQRAKELPSWANLQLMKEGSVFFAKHAEMIMSLLGLLSLPYCYTAANGAMVLYLSETIRKQTTKRLYDTAMFVWETMAPNAFDRHGRAYEEILKVRIMHAVIRYYTFKSGKWDNVWGVPINQEDMAGTNLSFSLIVIRGLRLLGFNVSQREQTAYLHLWGVIGYFSGLEEDLIPKNSKLAHQLDQKIKKRQFVNSAHGEELTKSLTEHIIRVNKGPATSTEILGLMRYLLGAEIADQLAIEAPVLSKFKITLQRTINFLKSMKPHGSPSSNYAQAFARFKNQSSIHIDGTVANQSVPKS